MKSMVGIAGNGRRGRNYIGGIMAVNYSYIGSPLSLQVRAHCNSMPMQACKENAPGPLIPALPHEITKRASGICIMLFEAITGSHWVMH